MIVQRRHAWWVGLGDFLVQICVGLLACLRCMLALLACLRVCWVV